MLMRWNETFMMWSHLSLQSETCTICKALLTLLTGTVHYLQNHCKYKPGSKPFSVICCARNRRLARIYLRQPFQLVNQKPVYMRIPHLLSCPVKEQQCQPPFSLKIQHMGNEIDCLTLGTMREPVLAAGTV